MGKSEKAWIWVDGMLIVNRFGNHSVNLNERNPRLIGILLFLRLVKVVILILCWYDNTIHYAHRKH